MPRRKKMLPLVLASSSVLRKQLLKKLKIPFDVISPDIDETPFPDEKPQALALRLAEQKASAVKDKFPAALIIGSDLVIMCDNVRLDKPMTAENAIKQLQLVSGKAIDAYAGLCLLNTQTGQVHTALGYYQVRFRPLSQKTIEAYVKQDDPLLCAGSIKAESLGIVLFSEMSGKDPTALLGLPLISLTDFLMEYGWELK